ncbi:hypothetical protein [Litorivivens sp.]|uniref:hypothetical protein n=1 Tax=Litorivivens sp. TaxID=2020868 RepID=UPI00356A6102
MSEKDKELPVGTTEPFARMHRWLQRGLFVCLVALVIEASLSLPGLLIWFGWPTLSVTEVCHELMKVRWHNDDAECLVPHPLWGDNEGTIYRDTAYDEWGIQPRPKYRGIHYRDLVTFRDERLAREAAAREAAEAQGIDVSAVAP